MHAATCDRVVIFTTNLVITFSPLAVTTKLAAGRIGILLRILAPANK